jgi:hypothetical protein
MIQRIIITGTLFVAVLDATMAPAEIGPCLQDGQDSQYCGDGNGAARIIPNTTSPSHRLALAWRFLDRPPTTAPDGNEAKLESLIVRIRDGVVLARSPSTYWNIGTRYAPRQYVSAAWSPNSLLLVKTTGYPNESDTAEFFAFGGNDSVIGPINLIKVLGPAIRAFAKDTTPAAELRFCYKPEPMIGDSGLISACMFITGPQRTVGPSYDLTAQITSVGDSFDVKIISISENSDPAISVIVH